jgi:hypothetical protein
MKKMILLLGLILGICNMGVTAFAEEGQVEVQINTRDEKGFAYEGIEGITLDVYDLTEWRSKRASSEKEDERKIAGICEGRGAAQNQWRITRTR